MDDPNDLQGPPRYKRGDRVVWQGSPDAGEVVAFSGAAYGGRFGGLAHAYRVLWDPVGDTAYETVAFDDEIRPEDAIDGLAAVGRRLEDDWWRQR